MGSSLSFAGNDRYVVRRQLGGGAFGIVYAAYDRERGEDVALKVLRATGPDALYAFKREFRAIANISHPNLVALYDLFSDTAHWFFTMELVDGVDFTTYVRSDGPAMPRAFEQLARGVLALHASCTLHRDIKPSNVLVTTEGRVVLLDFGLATGSDERDWSIREGLVGTAAYMAPEQGTGVPVTDAADWYGVGAMLYEALTGRVPFDGHAAKILVDKQVRDPTPVLVLNPSAPVHLADLCMRLLERNPDHRIKGAEIAARLGIDASHRSGARGALFDGASDGGETFLGRDAELSRIERAFDATCEGRTLRVEIVGRSGIGKTHLLEHFLRRRASTRDAIVLRSRCYERESVPYKALDGIVDALSHHLRTLDEPTLRALVPESIEALLDLFPVLARISTFAHAPRTAEIVRSRKERRRRGFLALRDLFRALGRKHTLIVAIDDLQWGDVDSVALLLELLRPPDPPRFLLVVTYRSDESEYSPALQALFDAQPDEYAASVERIELAPFDRDLSRALVEQLLPRDASTRFSDAIAEESGGNPFFLLELVRHLAQVERRGGEFVAHAITLDRVVLARLEQLPVEARRLLEVLAVSGQPITERPACRAAELGAETSATLALLRNERLLRTDSKGRLAIYHDRIREVLFASLATEDVARIHRSVAVGLESTEQPDPEALVAHWSGAGDADKAFRYAIVAADKALEALAFERGARFYQMALSLGRADDDGRVEILEKLGRAWANAGYASKAAAAYIDAAKLRPTSKSLELRQLAASQLLCSGHFDDGLALLEGVLSDVGLVAPRSPVAALFAVIVGRIRLALRGFDFRERAAREIDPRLLARIDVCWNCFLAFAAVDFIKGAAFQNWLVRQALDVGEPQRVAQALISEAALSGSRGGRAGEAKVRSLLARAEALGERLDDPTIRATIWLAQGIAMSCLGHKRRGLELCDRAEQAFRSISSGLAWWVNTANSFSIEALATLGELSELRRRLPSLLNEADGHADIYAGSVFRARAYPTWMATDKVDAGRVAIRRAVARWERAGFYDPHLWQMIAEARFDLYEGKMMAAWTGIEARWPELARSRLLVGQFRRIHAYAARGSAALAAACAMEARDRRVGKLVSVAKGAARRLRSEAVPWSVPQAELLEAGIVSHAGDKERASMLLASASAHFEAVDMKLHAAIAQYHRGSIIRSTEGAALRADAVAAMKLRDVTRPDRFSAAYAPGFGSATAH